MNIKSTIFAAALLQVWLLSACHSSVEHDHNSEEHEAAHEHEHGHDEIVVEPEDAEKLGIATAVVEPQPFSSVIPVSGRLTNSSAGLSTISAKTPGIVTLRADLTVGQNISAGQSIGSVNSSAVSGGDPNRASKAALDAAKRELDRLEPLLKEGIATRSEYNAALAAYQSAKASYSPAASGSLTSPISGVITELLVQSGQFVEAGAPIAVISKGGSLLLTADLPERFRSQLPMIDKAFFRPSYSSQWLSTDSLGGSLVKETASDAVAKAGYIPVVFSICNDGSLSAGSFAEINLIVGSQEDAITVPNEAIAEQQGVNFLYVKKGDHAYEKRKVTVGETDGRNSQIISGIKPGEEVVVKGAIMVRLAESNGAVPEGHSHHH